MIRAITAALHGENGNHIGAPGAEGLRGVKAVLGTESSRLKHIDLWCLRAGSGHRPTPSPQPQTSHTALKVILLPQCGPELFGFPCPCNLILTRHYLVVFL